MKPLFCLVSILVLAASCTAKILKEKRQSFVETLPPGVVTPPPEVPITEVGCFQDRNGDRALPTLIANYRHDSFFDWFDMRTTIQKCANAAKNHGYTWFSIQFYGECWSGPNAPVTYNKHGPSSNCWNGVGKDWTNMVYRITTNTIAK